MANKNDTNLDSAVATARAAWLCNATVADGNCALRQLHGLSRLLLENRDEIVARLVHDSDNRHGAAVWERELAVIQLDLVAHIKSVSGSVSATPSRADKSKTAASFKKGSSDSVSTSTLPRGVSLIVSNCGDGKTSKDANPLRYAIALLAASIAARNAVVLALPDDRDDNGFLQLLMDKAAAYLDQLAIQIVAISSIETLLGLPLPAVDHVLICGEYKSWRHCVNNVNNVNLSDDKPDRWSAYLASNIPSIFVPISAGYNIAIIPESEDIGSSPLQEADVAQLVSNSRAGTRPFDGLDAVFVHHASFDAVRDRISSMSRSISVHTEHKGPLAEAIAMARQKSSLLLINASSTEEIVDSINKLPRVAQLTVLGPMHAAARATADYIEQWTSSNRFSIRSIPVAASSIDGTLLSPSLFSKTRLVTHRKEETLPDNVAELRSKYEKAIPVLEPEHPGGRIDFFVQVEYAVKSAAALVAVGGLAAAYYGFRYWKHR